MEKPSIALGDAVVRHPPSGNGLQRTDRSHSALASTREKGGGSVAGRRGPTRTRFFAWTSAPSATSISATAAWPACAASISGVKPCASGRE
eukprot:scaffold5880_cov32-Tisochrysis_lutea.AAC.3